MGKGLRQQRRRARDLGRGEGCAVARNGGSFMVDRADTFPQRNQIMLLSAACRIAEGGEIRACLVVRACNDHHVLRARLVGVEREVGWVGLGFVTGRDHDVAALICRARVAAAARVAVLTTALLMVYS